MADLQCSPYPDFMNMSALLTEEQRMIESSVRDFVKKEIEPNISENYLKEEFPTKLIPQLGEMGLLGSNLKGYGLPGMDGIAYGLVMKELERCDSGLRSFASVQGALAI